MRLPLETAYMLKLKRLGCQVVKNPFGSYASSSRTTFMTYNWTKSISEGFITY